MVGWGNSVIKAKKYIPPVSFNLRTSPNPFNPKCSISFQVSIDSNIKVNIYNSKGQFLETLANNYFHQGNHIIYWHPKMYASGIYFVQISDAINTQNQKVIYLK